MARREKSWQHACATLPAGFEVVVLLPDGDDNGCCACLRKDTTPATTEAVLFITEETGAAYARRAEVSSDSRAVADGFGLIPAPSSLGEATNRVKLWL